MYCIYNVESTKLYTRKYYKTPAAAKAAITRAALDKTEWAFAEVKYFRDCIEKMVTRTNLMSGKEFQESANTPYYCSPASETYWSM